MFAHLYPRRAAGLTALLLFLVVLTLVGLDRAFSVSCARDGSCVTLDQLRDGAALPQAMRLYDRHGELFAEVAGPLRRTVRYEEIPELMVDAFVAVEDRRFWEHDGIDGRGIARAAFRNLLERDIAEGASTIPMQLVRTIWAESLRGVGPWRRKIIEARTAPRLVEALGHERVLELYLNAIYLGNGIYGVGRAAEHYFGSPVSELDVGRIATLVGITRAPELYDPRQHPDRAIQVRSVVLGILVDAGLISAESAATADALGLDLSTPDPLVDDRRERSHVTAAVTRELRRVAPELAGAAGLSIHTTIDPIVQSLGEAAVLEQLERIEAGAYGPVEETDAESRLEAAALALSPADGAVLAWVGGRDFQASEFDRVEQARRQVGSLVKPLLVVTALERGIGILDMVSSDAVAIPTDQGPWIPADHVAETELPMREALIRSSNRAAAHLGARLGIEELARVGTRVGIGGPVPVVPSSSIGAFDASLLEMTRAYVPLGNGGLPVDPYLIGRIEGADGQVIWTRPTPGARPGVISAQHAFVVLDAMRDVVSRGTGTAVRGAGYLGPAAGKTGTTNEGRDAWFVGLTPEMVAGVWVGFDLPREIVHDAGGGILAAPAWGAWMESVRRSPRPRSGAWVPPVGVERVRYRLDTGEVVSLTCRTVSAEEPLREAWVQVGRYARAPCSDDVPGWLGRLWRRVRPGG